MFETGAVLDGEYNMIPMPAPQNCTDNPSKFVVAGDDGTYNPSARYFINRMTNGVSGILREYVRDPLVVFADRPDGCYTNGQDVALNCLQEGATIFRRQAYEGWMGVEWQDETYEGPFTVDHPLDLYFFARKDGLEDSAVVSTSVEIYVIPKTWALNYPNFVSKFGSDFTAALGKPTGKVGADGVPMLVWQDYVAGTDPTDEKDVFTASITVVGGKVTISYLPELDDVRKAMRKYTTSGKKSLVDATWSEVPEGCEAGYNFFRVSVEMR